MIDRMNLQLGKSHNIRNTRNSHRQERSNYIGHLKNKEGANSDSSRTQGENHHKQDEMVRMKKTQSKRGPLGKEPPKSSGGLQGWRKQTEKPRVPFTRRSNQMEK
jgi:hypothetical protein